MLRSSNDGRQDRRCFFCGVYENVKAVVLHHAEKRSRNPSRVDDETNKCPLCSECHDRTERDESFLQEILTLWTHWQGK